MPVVKTKEDLTPGRVCVVWIEHHDDRVDECDFMINFVLLCVFQACMWSIVLFVCSGLRTAYIRDFTDPTACSWRNPPCVRGSTVSCEKLCLCG